MASKGFLRDGEITARGYQEELALRVLEKGNSLVVAPTALGKTLVAVLVANQLLLRHPSQKILLLSPTKPLAVQHHATLLRLLDIPSDQITLLTGAVLPAKREKLLSNSVMISATPQAIENDCLNGRFELKAFSLVVFDECHRAVGDYSYVFLARQFMKQNPKGLILGLTASPGGNQERISDVCKNLFITNVEIKSHSDADVAEHVNPIQTKWEFVELPESFLQIKALLRGFQNEQLVFLKRLGLAKNLSPNRMPRTELLALQSHIRNELSRNPTQNPALFTAISRLAALLKVTHAEILLETQGIGALHDYFEKMKTESGQSGASKALKFLLADPRIQKSIEFTAHLRETNSVHPKQTALLRLIETELDAKPNSKLIVFNHYRDSVRDLVAFLEKNSQRIKPLRFVGQAAKENDPGLTQKEQMKIITQFREGDYNVLVASSVGEEGLDIPSVDHVIFFEPVPSEIRMIQRRGRTGRARTGKCTILIAKNTRDEAHYWSARAKEKEMLQTLQRLKKNGNELLVTQKPVSTEHQTTLHKYAENQQNKVVIFVDHREQASSVSKTLLDLGAVIHTRQLEVGDYILSESICVERKTVEDFLTSMIDGRLFSQLVSLSESYPSAFMILEGSLDNLFSLRNIHKNAILGAMTSIAVNYRIPILFSRDAHETAEFLFVTAKREQLGKDKHLRIRTGRKGLTAREMKQFVVESFPLVGPAMAKALLTHFQTIKSIVNANEKELQEVANMGEKKARRISKLVNEKYGEQSASAKNEIPPSEESAA